MKSMWDGLYAPTQHGPHSREPSGHKAPPMPLKFRTVALFLVVVVSAVTPAARTAAFDGSPFGPVVAESLALPDGHDASRGNRALMLEGGYDALLLRMHLIRQAKT